MGFTIRGFIWDIPILIFAYVLFFFGPYTSFKLFGFQSVFLNGRVWGLGSDVFLEDSVSPLVGC